MGLNISTHVRPFKQSRIGFFFPILVVLPTIILAMLFLLTRIYLQLVGPAEDDGQTGELQFGLPARHGRADSYRRVH